MTKVFSSSISTLEPKVIGVQKSNDFDTDKVVSASQTERTVGHEESSEIVDHFPFSPLRRFLVEGSLFLACFAITVSDFAFAGLLPQIGMDLKVTEVQISDSIALYALGAAVGAPSFAFFGFWIPRKYFVMLLLVVHLIGNILTFTAISDVHSLLGIRCFCGIAHGAFLGSSTAVAADLRATVSQKITSITRVSLSGGVALICGTVMSTEIGQRETWQTTYIVLSCFQALSFFVILFAIPLNKYEMRTRLLSEIKAFNRLSVWFVLFTLFFAFVGLFCTFNFISKVVLLIAKLQPSDMSGIMSTFGSSGFLVGIILVICFQKFGFKIAVIHLTICAVGMAVYPTISTDAVGVYFAVFWLGFIIGIIPLAQNQLAKVSLSAQMLSAVALFSSSCFGGALGGKLGGWVLDNHHNITFEKLAYVSLPFLCVSIICAALAHVFEQRDVLLQSVFKQQADGITVEKTIEDGQV
eukprot:GDKJ01013782.1.p1 GENE.GDKJ01013782.1~~GDKJ01013782.1.p1  ORF type:complete len:476 (-),score=73.82 GDKJ01013782.1:204-1607(-)